MRWWNRMMEFTSFGNGKGQLSFNKMVTFTALWCFVAAVFGSLFYLRQQPHVAVWSFGFGVVGAGFGLKGYLGAAKTRRDISHSTTHTETRIDAAEVIRALKDRDPENGYQPTTRVPQLYDD